MIFSKLALEVDILIPTQNNFETWSCDPFMVPIITSSQLINLSDSQTQGFFSSKQYVWKGSFLGSLVKLSHEELDPFIDANCAKPGDKWTCLICGHSANLKTDVARHIEARHVILPELLCHICHKSCKTRDSLRRHIGRYHQWNQTQDLAIYLQPIVAFPLRLLSSRFPIPSNSRGIGWIYCCQFKKRWVHRTLDVHAVPCDTT